MSCGEKLSIVRSIEYGRRRRGSYRAVEKRSKRRAVCTVRLSAASGQFARHTLEPLEDVSGRKIHGPEIGFARTLQSELAADRYLLVKVTGNIPVDEPNFLWSIDQSYMQTALRLFAQACILEGSDPRPSAILMAQGIDEALSDRFANYRANLIGCINKLRSHFSDLDLPFIIGQSVNSPYADAVRMESVRQAQYDVGFQLLRIGFFSIDDLAPFVRGHHLSSCAQLEFGRRFANSFLRLSPSSLSGTPQLQTFVNHHH